MCACNPKGQSYTGLHQKKRGQQIKGSDSASLCHSGETLPALETSAQVPKESHKRYQREETALLQRKAENDAVVQTGEKKALSSPYCGLSILKEDL